MTNLLNDAGLFLVQTLFDLYIIILMLRIILQRSGVHFYNPASQFVIKITNPVVVPVRRFIPSWRGFDFATFSVIVILEIIKLYLLIALSTGVFANILGVLLWAAGDLLSILLNIYFWAILIAAVLSWLGQIHHNTIVEALFLMTEPLLRPVRRIIPPLSGIDISPVLVLIVLKLLDITLVKYLILLGAYLAGINYQG